MGRSKEVDKAIKTLTQYTFVGSKVTQLEACECIDIVLNYISKLEEIPILLGGYVEKNKIREIIEKERCKTIDGYNDWKYDEKVYNAELHMINTIEKAILKGE